ncbi:hypothetical protein PIB30_050631 [Stylosanthes scabra]|uniref:F-box associated beta-propeller type 1 domain-containing protein n=1 Tax=Stylosanthes scabra TaxID=79078 RepID=A0ABU6SHI9_9FABA|nr:hypothetical protein [Stylosanthes scabra]
MEPNRSNPRQPSLLRLKRSLKKLIEDLREQKRLLITKEVFGDDILWNVFVNADPKLAARCRILGGCIGLTLRRKSSDHGNICLRVTENGLNSRIMVWNPLTRDYMWIHDDPWARRDFPVNVMAYGYLKDGLEYHIVNFLRRTFDHGSLFWSVHDSEVEKWTLERSYNTEIRKLGPQSVVSDNIVFWIARDGLCSGVPTYIVTFNLRWMEFHHGDIPVEAPTENNALTKFMGGVAFLTYRDIGHSREVVVWSVYREGHDTLMWEKFFTISDFAIIHTPSLLFRSSIISVLDHKSSYGPANNNQRSDLFLYILRHMRGAAELFYHNFWEEDVQLKTVTLHSDGLYPVRKDPPYTLE